MSGLKAKTNFPLPENTENDDDRSIISTTTTTTKDSPLSQSALSDILGAKLRKCCKNNPAPSITCLKLDNDNSIIGVWQNRPGSHSGSKWVMKLELNKKSTQMSGDPSPSQSSVSSSSSWEMDEENRVALQMVEELLDLNGGGTMEVKEPLYLFHS